MNEGRKQRKKKVKEERKRGKGEEKRENFHPLKFWKSEELQ